MTPERTTSCAQRLALGVAVAAATTAGARHRVPAQERPQRRDRRRASCDRVGRAPTRLAAGAIAIAARASPAIARRGVGDERLRLVGDGVAERARHERGSIDAPRPAVRESRERRPARRARAGRRRCARCSALAQSQRRRGSRPPRRARSTTSSTARGSPARSLRAAGARDVERPRDRRQERPRAPPRWPRRRAQRGRRSERRGGRLVPGEVDRPRPERVRAAVAQPRQRARLRPRLVTTRSACTGSAARRPVLDDLVAVRRGCTRLPGRGARQAPALPAEHRLVDVDRRSWRRRRSRCAVVPWMKPSSGEVVETLPWPTTSTSMRRAWSVNQALAVSSQTSTRMPRVTSSVSRSGGSPCRDGAHRACAGARAGRWVSSAWPVPDDGEADASAAPVGAAWIGSPFCLDRAAAAGASRGSGRA